MRLSAIQKEDLSKHISLKSRSASLDWLIIMNLIPEQISVRKCVPVLCSDYLNKLCYYFCFIKGESWLRKRRSSELSIDKRTDMKHNTEQVEATMIQILAEMTAITCGEIWVTSLCNLWLRIIILKLTCFWPRDATTAAGSEQLLPKSDPPEIRVSNSLETIRRLSRLTTLNDS